jgi:carbamoyl-phosphate synthase small subunit
VPPGYLVSGPSGRTRLAGATGGASGDTLVEDETGLRGDHLVEVAGPLDERVETGRVGDVDDENNVGFAGYLPGEINRIPLREQAAQLPGPDVDVDVEFDHRADVPGPGRDGEPLDDACLDQLVDTVADRPFGRIDLLGNLGKRGACVAPEDGQYLAVEVVHGTVLSGEVYFNATNFVTRFESNVYTGVIRTHLAMETAYIAIEGERVVEGRARSPGTTRGELVFTTAYTGYEESLTDPSYARQILTFSYPLVGNYGVREERFESDRVQPEGVLARELTEDVADWLRGSDVPAVDQVDTREFVTEIRDQGAMACGIAAGPEATRADALAELDACVHMSEHTDIGAAVSVPEPVVHNSDGDGARVVLVDCGAKGSIVESLVARDAVVHRLPYDASVEAVAAVDPDLLFISNGPGDPENFDGAAALVDEYAGDVPLAGICLGQQVIAGALGGRTTKMEFGHRGVNQPVRDLRSDRVVMTTQNHGYTVADPGDILTVTQRNVNDDTPEGLDSEEMSIMTRQYHPEANPGPHDSLSFFDDVLAMTE